tara:strand:- start:18053 stop:18976 length:924 start_codon:yes stop_codon:yes gene_type:complete
MPLDLKSRIYKAQTIGNVEPIEHMIPYPNLRSLIDGQNIKYGERVVYKDYNLTSSIIYDKAQQIANWLQSKGIQPKERVLVKPMAFPFSVIIPFGIWTLGASIVIDNDDDTEKAIKKTNSKIVLRDDKIINESEKFPTHYEPRYKPLLEDEAAVLIKNSIGYQYSNYNLLVNTNGILQEIDLFSDQSYFVNLKANSMPWLILQIILPLYSGSTVDSQNPTITIGNKDSDFLIKEKWNTIEETNPPTIYACNENTAFLSVNKKPLHLTEINENQKPLFIKGHSVMMGYLDKEQSNKAYKNNALHIAKI